MRGNSVRVTLTLAGVIVLSGCAGKANHPQCQNLKNEAVGAQFGATMAGTYIAQIQANTDERQYERCEEMFDVVQYQAQLQQEQAQAQIQEQEQEQERKRVMMEKIKGPEMQRLLKGLSLADLVDCEKGVGEDSDKFTPDVKAIVSRECVGEIDRRVDSGKVSRAKVEKMLNQG